MELRGLAFDQEQGPYRELTHPLSQAGACNRSLPKGLPGGKIAQSVWYKIAVIKPHLQCSSTK